jgi:4-amino-4-deoxy-L-arabinose transferase-like glycosyltransferase
MLQMRDRLGLITLWLIVTLYNLFKPYQIDDTAHLIIASWIAAHPLHPMQGMLNWSGTTEPIFHTNQPHLYFYILAGWGSVFGFSEVAMHALQSLFAGMCILLFYRIARSLAGSQALWLTAMLALNPAFTVEQNLMVDVPLLACWLGFFEPLLCRIEDTRQHRRYALAGLACAAAILVKYSSLLLLPILGGSIILERRWREAWSLAIPVAALVLWSAFNLFDYGGVHLTTAFHSSTATYVPRAHKSVDWLRKLVKSCIAWGVAVGALTPFGVLALAQFRPRWANGVYALCLGGLIALALATARNILPDHLTDKILWLGFAASALLLTPLLRPSREPLRVYLLAWFILTSLFYILFAPFVAARHVLLILPAISLLAATRCEIPVRGKVFALLITSIISAGLCVSDFRFAQFYKTEAAVLPAAFPAHIKIWAAGHWGWQYYATQHGMAELDIKNSNLTPGDVILVPREADHQLPHGIILRHLATATGNFSKFDPFCTARPSRFYLSYTFRGPWSLSAECDQHIDIFEVVQAGK